MSDALSLVRGPSNQEDLRVMDGFHCLDHVQLERFLERRRANPQFPLELSLAENLVEVLRRANGFVPSEAGSILLDNPSEKKDNRRNNSLTFIAAFGDKSEGLLGQTIPAHRGIAGRVYLTGEAYVTPAAREDRFFYGGVDEQTRYHTESLIAIPIRIEQEVCGVLELINRLNSSSYSGEDRNLLEIFAGYISISIQNVLDGRQAQEIAKRDNLTGLYNDRYLHIALSNTDRALPAGEAGSGGPLPGPRLLQEGQRHPWASRRQPGAPRGGAPPAPEARRGAGLGGPLRRRRVRPPLPRADLERAVDIAEEIRAEILATTFCAAPGEIQPEPLQLNGLTCSIGVATLQQHIMDEMPS